MKSRRCTLATLILILLAVLAGCYRGTNRGGTDSDVGHGTTGAGGGQASGASGFLVFPNLTIRTAAEGPPVSGLYLEGSIVPGQRLGGGDGFMPQGDVRGSGTLTPGGRVFLIFPSLRMVPEQAGEEILTPNLRGSSQGESFTPTSRKLSY